MGQAASQGQRRRRAVEPGLLLFAAFVVRGLAEDAGSTAAAASAAMQIALELAGRPTCRASSSAMFSPGLAHAGVRT
jgi:hypothetical protein